MRLPCLYEILETEQPHLKHALNEAYLPEEHQKSSAKLLDNKQEVMPKHNKLIKQNNFYDFITDVDANSLSSYLYSEGFISTDELDEINYIKTPRGKSSYMTILLEKKFNTLDEPKRKELVASLSSGLKDQSQAFLVNVFNEAYKNL